MKFMTAATMGIMKATTMGKLIKMIDTVTDTAG